MSFFQRISSWIFGRRKRKRSKNDASIYPMF